MFQIHLWIGLLTTLYLCLIGVTGSILVFGHELYLFSRPALFRPLSTVPSDLASRIPFYLEAAHRTSPQLRLSEVYLPMQDQPTVQVQGEPLHPTAFNQYRVIYLDPASASVLGTTDNHFWVAWLRELHVRLLAGRTGAVVNGCGAVCLLLMALSGMVIWWSGLKHWSRGMTVNFRRRFSRINYDLHSAIGFWSLLFLIVWSLSGVYFSWPDQFVSALNLVIPAKDAAYPSLRVSHRTDGKTELSRMIEDATKSLPGFRLLALDLPATDSDPLTLILSRSEQLERSVYLLYNPYSGQQLARWERGPGRTLGTQMVYWLMPLHFGESWGLVCKIIWFIFGLSLPTLAITGLVLYWNRYLRRRIRSIL